MYMNTNTGSELYVLDQYYRAFIGLEDDYEFYVGLIDYLKYADSVPKIESIAQGLNNLRIKRKRG
jgi:hypothetical protein